MQNHLSYKPSHSLYLLAIVGFILFARLGAAPIYILDEAKNAQCAREMLQRNDWIVPTFNGELRTDKPVLHYYFMMLAYKMFGVTEFAARFFSAVLGLLTILTTWLFSRRFIGELPAFCTCLVLATSTQFLFEFRLSVPDPYLIFFVTAGLLTCFTYLQQNRFGYLMISAVCFSLAALAKGPVALALPGLCLLIWVVWKKKWKLIFTWKIIAAALITAIIVLPWYMAVHNATNGAWTRGFFVEHNLNRFSDPQEGHGGFFLVTLLFVLVGLLPFTSFSWQVFKTRKQVFTNDLVQFSGIVVLAFVIFFSIASTKLPNYPMPCYPFVAIIIGYYLSLGIQNNVLLKKYPLYICLAITFMVPVGGYFAIGQEVEASHVNWVSLLLLAGGVALLVVAFRWKHWTPYARLIGIGVAYSVFNIVALQVVYPVLYWQNPVAKTIARVKTHPEVFSYQIFNPGYNFYLDGTIRKFTNLDTLRIALQKQPRAILITRTAYIDSLKALPLTEVTRHHDLFETPTTILYVPK